MIKVTVVFRRVASVEFNPAFQRREPVADLIPSRSDG